MLDKSKLRYYIGGFSYMIKWCKGYINIVDGHETYISKEIKEILKKEHQPNLEKLRNYLIAQLRSIQKDESLLKQILKKEKVIETELSIEEIIIAAISEIIVNLNRSFDLLNSEHWNFCMSEFILFLDAAETALSTLRCATDRVKELVNKESPELKAKFPEHQNEIKRILLELCD